MTEQKRLILFDYGGVLVESPIAHIRKYSASHNVPEEVGLRLVFGSVADEGAHPWQLLEKSQITYRDYCDLYSAQEALAQFPLPQPTLAFIYELTVHAELLDHIFRVESAATIIGIATNNIAEMRSQWRRQVGAPRFDAIFDSSELYTRKPERTFFRAIESLAHARSIDLASVWLIDDSPENVIAAKDFGINGLLASPSEAGLLDQLRGLSG